MQLGSAAPVTPDTLDPFLLAPSQPYSAKVGIGQAKFLRFSCKGGPADVVISLSTYAERADPLLFLSLDPHKMPTFAQHDASSFAQWREDQAGDHYVIAKGVSPDGGIIGLVNMQYFAGEELRAVLSIRCTFIIAFDTLFWNHLKLASVCPVGQHVENGVYTAASSFCAGHGSCGRNGLCECDGDFTGPACEHSKSDVVVAADGHYDFKVETGRYQYFRIRIPPRFPGGYLAVTVMSSQPLVVLVRGNEIPTKSRYDMSNFDDWVNRRLSTVLKFKVPSAETISQPAPYVPGVGGLGLGGLTPGASAPGFALPPRRLLETLQGVGSLHGWPDLFRLAAGLESESKEGRSLQGGFEMSPADQCPQVAPMLSNAACQTQAFMDCRASCSRCVTCVKGGTNRIGNMGVGDMGCSDACDACMSPGCLSNLAYCAADVPCESDAARKCDSECGGCMSCFDSNDANCGGCQCCMDCLPIAAKCSLGEHDGAYNRVVFVGIFNHRRYYNDQYIVHAVAEISLVADSEFASQNQPTDWIADLYDPFYDIRALEVTQRQIYPAGEQYIFSVSLMPAVDVVGLEVQLFKQRLSLLHISGIPVEAEALKLQFTPGPNVTHILSSSRAAPKTFFDFDMMHEYSNGQVVIPCGHLEQVDGQSRSAWVALWGAKDGHLQMTVRTAKLEQQAPASGFAMVPILGLICALIVLALVFGGAEKLRDMLGWDPDVSMMERLGCLIRERIQGHESTVSLTRSPGSLSGYIGSDVIDRSVEDQYLHRGGQGDDGI